MAKWRIGPQGFQAQLLFTLILASLLPLAVGGLVFFTLVNQTITDETFKKVAFARDSKASEIAQYLTFAQRQAESLSQTSNVRYSIGEFYGFSYALSQISKDADVAAAKIRALFGLPVAGSASSTSDSGNDALLREAVEYANAHRRFHDSFIEFLQSSEFDNLYLVNMHGRVVYSTQTDNYLGLNLAGNTSVMATLYSKLRNSPETEGIFFQDFSRDPMTGQFVAYLAINIDLYRNSQAALVLRLPATGLSRLLADGDVVTLVSSQHDVIASSDDTRLPNGTPVTLYPELDTQEGVDTLANGLIGVPTLSAWRQLQVFSSDWTLVVDSDEATAFAASKRLNTMLLIIGAIAAAVLTGISLLLARSMTDPIRSLARAAEAVADGALDERLPEYDRPVEYARLSQAVGQMRKVLRDQLGLISDKNSELENHIREVAEKNAKLEQADRLKDQFLANTSHELRTPLNGIIGISETLGAGAMGEFAPAQKSQLQLIAFSARRLSRLVDDLLDLYRIREGRLRLDMQSVDVSHSVRNVLQLATPILKGEPVSLRVDIDESTPPVYADPVRYEQILYNLISNAIKYAGDGEIQLSATVEDIESKPHVALSIEDRGPGIAPESLERIFHPLEQASIDGQISNKKEGAGLGLAIARNLSLLMDGSLTVSSEVGEGSKFTINLPAAEAPALPRPNHARPAEGLHATITSYDDADAQTDHSPTDAAPCILLVDDEPINLQVLKNVLLPQGYRVVDCDNGSDALQIVSEQKPDLIVLDVMMSGMSGLDVARHLRRRYSLLDLPIILLTARSRTRDMIAGFEVGANDYVVKPFVKDELLSRISTLLQAAGAKRSSEENIELRDEIERRIQVEDALRLSQRRMGQLLEALEDGLICANRQGTVTYANQAASRILSASIKLNSTSLSELFPQEVKGFLDARRSEDDEDSIKFSIEERHLILSTFDLLPEAGSGTALLISDATRESSTLLHTVRDAVDSALPAITNGNEEDASAEADDPDTNRMQMVLIMTDCLAIWKKLTGKGKVEFSEESGIWRVSLDKTSLQTRTLDKYLLLETLPAHPRWRDVVRSAEFLINYVGSTTFPVSGDIKEMTDKLGQDLATLRRMLQAG